MAAGLPSVQYSTPLVAGITKANDSATNRTFSGPLTVITGASVTSVSSNTRRSNSLFAVRYCSSVSIPLARSCSSSANCCRYTGSVFSRSPVAEAGRFNNGLKTTPTIHRVMAVTIDQNAAVMSACLLLPIIVRRVAVLRPSPAHRPLSVPDAEA